MKGNSAGWRGRKLDVDIFFQKVSRLRESMLQIIFYTYFLLVISCISYTIDQIQTCLILVMLLYQVPSKHALEPNFKLVW